MARVTRRGFLQGSAALGGCLAAGELGAGLFAGGQQVIRVGLVGCGGRGSGAAAQILNTGRDVQLTAMADLFPSQLNTSKGRIRSQSRNADQFQVTPEREFVGFDAYEELLASGVDVVLLTTPAAFRPEHFAAAVEAGVHVFMEKPVAVDPVGVRSLLESAKVARAKSLKVAVGLHHRHDPAYQEVVRRIGDGEIGDVKSLSAEWLTKGVEPRLTRKQASSEMELQMRNWLQFVWAGGEANLEQLIHGIDVCNWVKGTHPVAATAVCSRTERTASKYGDTHDEFVVDYRFADGTTMKAHGRHRLQNAANRVGEAVVGTKGTADLKKGTIEGTGGSWTWSGRRQSAHQLEQDVLFSAIREDRPHSEIESRAESQLTVLMGRMAAYAGREVTWGEAVASSETFVPEKLALTGTCPTMPDKFGDYPVPARPVHV